MSVIGSNILAGASGQGGGYNLTKSLRFRSSATAYLNRTPASAGNRKTWTWSGWVKRGTLGVSQYFFSGGTGGGDTTQTGINFLADNKLNWLGGSGTQYRTTTQVFRDPSAWYHIVLAFDTTLATANDRIKIYVNGTQITAFDNLTNPTQNVDYGVNQAEAHNIGRWTGASGYFDGYLAEVNFIDGQALTPSSFGETSTTTGVWIPKKYTGTFGTNGFYLPFTDTTSTSTLGTDFSGNSNTWTVNNISLTSGSTYDSMNDVPTLTSATTANYAVINPLKVSSNAATISSANLNVLFTLGSGQQTRRQGTIGVSTGKYYFEVLVNAVGGNYPAIGVMFSSTSDMNNYVGAEAGTFGYYSSGGVNGGGGGRTYSSYTANDVIGVAMDLTNSQLTFYKNGANAVTSGTTYESLTAGAEYVPAVSGFDNASFSINFGQRPFSYTPPSGFVALNTFNLPTPTIGATASSQANKYMNIALYTGTGSSQSITGLGFQPDWTWIKGRSGATDHGLYDAVRGVQKQLESNNTDSETTETTGLTAFGSDGFTVGALAQLNTSSATYVGWQWRASNATAVTNTAGSITSTVSASTTAGFSVVSYTASSSASTIGHGLGVAPSMIIQKNRDAVSDWGVYHISIGATKFLKLNDTAAEATNSIPWNDTTPTSTVFSIGTGYTSGNNYVAYCFAQVAGYSAFGSYTGNGSTDGPFIFTGFRPRFVMFKRTDAVEQWAIRDTARDTYNATELELFPNLSNAEEDNNLGIDLLSNGFKIRNSANRYNASSGTYIYMAFCESPFRYANAR